MSFSATSTGYWLEDGHILHANVEDQQGVVQKSTIDLDNYIANIDGHFQWGGVNYSQTASNIRLNGTYLEADLVAINGSTRHNQSINLDDRIANINGVLEYQE